jgi:hypothetical protein
MGTGKEGQTMTREERDGLLELPSSSQQYLVAKLDLLNSVRDKIQYGNPH